MTSRGHILIISYVFPPYPGIGGRRWAKFAKYLAGQGYIVHVFSSENPLKDTSLYLKDVLHENIIIHTLPSAFPAVHIKGVDSLFDKIWYRLTLTINKLCTKGNYYDRGIFWKRRLTSSVKKLVTNYNIKNIIVSGAPFSLLYYSSVLCKQYPGVKFMADLRDPWTWGTGYGMQTLSPDRKRFEERMEKKVIEEFDSVFVPVVEMQEVIQKKYPSFSEKIILLPHGYDESEIKIMSKTSSVKRRWIFYGTIYPEIEAAFKSLATFMNDNKDDVILDIYCVGRRFSEYFDYYHLLGNQVNYYEPLPPDVLFGKFETYDNVVIVQPDFAKDYITTKVYEIIYSQTPIILISSPGKLADFITRYHFGQHILPEKLNQFSALEDLPKKDSLPEYFQISDYSFSSLTSFLTSQFK